MNQESKKPTEEKISQQGTACPNPPGGNAPADKASIDKAPVDKAPVDKASVDKASVDKAPVDKAPVDKAPVDKAPVDKTSIDKASVDKASIDKAPTDKASIDKAPVEKAPAMPALLTASPSPHARKGIKTSNLMIDVLIALIPATVWGIAAFGWRAAVTVLAAVASSVLFEYLTQKLLKRPITVSDCSAAVTGLLLGLNLSPAVPLYVPIVGSAFAIIVVKQLFGGIGKNIVNPALAARVFLMLAWPSAMGIFPDAFGGFSWSTADAVASATPLGSLKGGLLPNVPILDLFLGKIPGCIGEISTLMLLIGGAYLLIRRVISWHIPVSFLGTVALLTLLFPRGEAGNLDFMLASLCSGGVMIGAFFMATDYVTCPVTNGGKLIYGVGCGLLAVFIRYFGGYPEGTSFAILIMNTLVWYIEMLTKPRVYGKSRREKKQKKGGAVHG